MRFPLSRPAYLLPLLALLPAPAPAQPGVLTVPPPLTMPPASVDPVEALGRYLRVLAVFPRNLDALTGAGRAALAIGDANAAISFFARAEQIAPGNGRIKAGLASALVQMEQPKTALKLFDEATALGVPDADIASDRGLARDLRGDSRRAQQDYALALRSRPDDETVRRLAVSQAISGDRAAAMATLDALLRRQDRAAWRIRAFVLALTGDRDGAEQAALAAMPRPQAQALMPFFGRLASLRAGEKAAAVHLGQFPSDGRSYSDRELFADADEAASPTPQPAGPRSDVPLIPAGQPFGTAALADAGGAASLAPRRRPGAGEGGPEPSYSATGRGEMLFAARARPAPPAAAPAGPPAAAPPPPPAAAPPPVRTAEPLPAPAAPPRATTAPAAAASAPPQGLALAVPSKVAVPTATPLPATPPVVTAAVAPATPPAAAIVTTLPPQPERPAIRAVELPASQASGEVASAAILITALGPALQQPIVAPPLQLAAAEPARPEPKPATKAAVAPAEAHGARVSRAKADAADPATEPKTKSAARDAKAADAKAKLDDKNAKPVKATDAQGKKDGRAAKAEEAKEKLAAKDAKDAKPAKGAKAKDAPPDKAFDKAKPADKSGERYWVQVASGANKSNLDRAWEKTKAKAPKLLAGRETWTAPWKQSNRLLVGPFKTEEEAQGFVNTLGKAGMVGMQFTSRGSAKVEKLSAK